MERLKGPLTNLFGEELIERSGVQMLLKSLQKQDNLQGKATALLEMFNKYTPQQIKKVINLMDSKIKGKIALDAWKQQQMHLMDFTKDDKEETSAPKAKGLPITADDDANPGLEEQLIRKLLPIVEHTLRDYNG